MLASILPCFSRQQSTDEVHFNRRFSVCAASVIITAVFAGVLLGLASAHILGQAGSVGFITSLAVGAALELAAILGIIWLVKISCCSNKSPPPYQVPETKSSPSNSSQDISEDSSEESVDEDEIPLHSAVLDKDLEKVKKYINPLSIEERDDKGNTALHRAAECGVKAILAELLERGSEVDAKNDKGRTPLHKAARYEFFEGVKMLLEKGANMEEKERLLTQTPLHLAVQQGYPDVVTLLVENGANVSARDEDGREPLHLAAIDANSDYVEILVQNGANINAKDVEGQTPLHQVIISYYGEDDVDENSYLKFVKTLIENGADVLMFDVYNKKASDYCKKDDSIKKFLLDQEN